MFCICAGQWEIPVITGDCPLPHTYSTVISLSGNRGVMFGGRAIDQNHDVKRCDITFTALNLLTERKIYSTS